jgi:pre-mRNA-splicing factor RBM22/SLT11
MERYPRNTRKTDTAARDLLKRLANSEPYYKRRRGDEEAGEGSGTQQKLLTGGTGPVRTRGGDGGGREGRGGGRGGRGRGRGRGARFPNANQHPPGPGDIAPPADQSITSLFLMGYVDSRVSLLRLVLTENRVEDDLAEHHIRTFFSAFGNIRSIVCVHRSRCAFVNFANRAGAEAAAESCQGRALIAGCPLRVQWGKPRPLGNVDRSQGTLGQSAEAGEADEAMAETAQEERPTLNLSSIAVPKPPGQDDDVRYPSQATT